MNPTNTNLFLSEPLTSSQRGSLYVSRRLDPVSHLRRVPVGGTGDVSPEGVANPFPSKHLHTTVPYPRNKVKLLSVK